MIYECLLHERPRCRMYMIFLDSLAKSGKDASRRLVTSLCYSLFGVLCDGFQFNLEMENAQKKTPALLIFLVSKEIYELMLYQSI